MLLWFSLLELCLVSTVRAQFPRDCATQESLSKKHCCPTWTDGSKCGENSGRGNCVPNPGFSDGIDHPVEDKRLNWPRNFYDEVCVCNRLYSGADCGRCTFNHRGDDCEKQNLVIRKNFINLSRSERVEFINALNLAKMTMSKSCVVLAGGTMENDTTTYTFKNASILDCFIASHNLNSKYVLENGTRTLQDLIHRSSAFPTWHRYLILSLEQELQELTYNPELSMPYWDWTKDNNMCGICTDDLVGASVQDGFLSPFSIFSHWKVACSASSVNTFCIEDKDEFELPRLFREPGVNAPNLPTTTDVEELLKWPLYDTPPYNSESNMSFRNCLEGFKDPVDGVTSTVTNHNLVHMFLGGYMSATGLSANDPVFWLHHTQMDRLLESWIKFQKANPNSYPENGVPGQGPNDNVFPALPPIKHKDLLQDSEDFGYSYSYLI
ncbi:tyrosinase-like [Lissotriton helveticus]